MLFFRPHATAVWFASNVGYVTQRAGFAGWALMLQKIAESARRVSAELGEIPQLFGQKSAKKGMVQIDHPNRPT
ncbi:hypothetical protein NC651_040604 [Populus alba x Populus x berolinensis]|nr:hypothetical protein NC651_040604 [Populus alba x Populus x berolinensis]